MASPLGFRAHSSWSGASNVLAKGASLQDVCGVAVWSSPHTFIKFYSLDMDSTPGTHVCWVNFSVSVLIALRRTLCFTSKYLFHFWITALQVHSFFHDCSLRQVVPFRSHS